MKSNIRDTATKFDNSEKTKEFVTDMDPEDIPIDVTYSQNELLEKLQSLNISFANNTSTAKLNKTFETKLNHNHPIHQRLKEMGKRSLMDVANKIKIEFDHRLVAQRAKIVKYFFNAHSGSPLTSLKKYISEPAAESNKAEIDKNHLIFEFLKSVPDNEIKKYTKKLGKNNLRNFDNMKSFIVNFFKYDERKSITQLTKVHER